MDLAGYKERVALHLERLGVESRPSDDLLVEAWNHQIPARKTAERHARLSRRTATSETQPPEAV